MTKALISLPSLALITTLALSGCSLSVGGGSSSQAQSQETRVSADSDSSAGSAKGSASAQATGTAASTGQAVAGYEPGQIPPIPMIALPDLSLLTQSTGAFTPDLTRSITSQPGVTVRPARCDASGSLVSGSTVLGGDGSMSTSSGATAVTNNGDGSGTYSDGKVSITNNGDGSGTYSDGKVSITINGDGSGTYSDDHLSVTVNGDGSGTYSDSATGEAITLDGKGSGTYSRGGVSITNNGDGSGTYSDGKVSITNLGDGSAIVNDATVSAKPVPKAGKVGTFPSIDAAKPVQSCGTVITLEDSVLFDFGSSDLRSEASTTLTNLATVLKDSKAPKVQVQGHTDSVSDDASNQTLSEQRAKAVTEALTSNGVTASIESVGYGETKPVAPNENSDGSDNPAGRRLNRRVEVFVPAF
ncbi:OmpA family protein [Actinomyces naeslundii]|uniref:OmpA family protein n=3 Tax=Actinomyces naeslundii TaxID=1655 RepID=J3F277_ACTNH|nr:OmpA family protein [Actinomyces naeslundii]EJN84362.1 OmpA family protein [Actinomyces naeslundii str. Howell 279]OMG23609.1 cell envelope biogenesis protein OmpA [Actinomyces naeslundii]OMG27285.1 cell envelope biogenesis protein OmpA [Actinomyces naeslundii]OMG28770.1 cell envelope biogenesis protein OmpA [Actinomyces naeslundii]OMG31884.1 cell envelope biogenesis protein OmpA [Actinomyces naeslundii]